MFMKKSPTVLTLAFLDSGLNIPVRQSPKKKKAKSFFNSFFPFFKSKAKGF